MTYYVVNDAGEKCRDHSLYIIEGRDPYKKLLKILDKELNEDTPEDEEKFDPEDVFSIDEIPKVLTVRSHG